MPRDPAAILDEALRDHRETVDLVGETLAPAILALARRLDAVLRAGGKVLVFGNGGSAADAQHFAAELVGRYVAERGALAGIALTTDTSALTAIGNDYGFDEVFARQVEALAARGDLAVGISTSGSSENVVRGLDAARGKGAATVALTGRTGGRLAERADVLLAVPSAVTARIQEAHALILHAVCEILDAERTP